MNNKITKSNFFIYLKPKFKLYILSIWHNILAVIATGGKQSQAPAIASFHYVPLAMTRLRLFIYTQLICLLSVVLLSESVGAKARLQQTQIAQQPTTTQQDATRAAAQKVFDEGRALYKQGTAESLRQAIQKWQEALTLWRKAEDKEWQATTLLMIGRAYSDLGEKQKALEYYNTALPMFRAVDNRRGEAITLNNIGQVYSDIGQKQKALEYFNTALPLYRAVDNKGGEANTLNNIGGVYDALGEKQKALEYYNLALPLYRAVDDKRGEAKTLNNIGTVYSDIGEKQKALEYFNTVLTLYRAVDDKRGEAITLNNIGLVYSNIGQKQKALEYYNTALTLYRAVDNKREEAEILNNIGAVYSDLGEKQKALKYFNTALTLHRAVDNKRGEAGTLNNIGQVYSDIGEKQKALEYFNTVLTLYRAVGGKGGEATTLNNIGLVYDALGQKQKALEYFNTALTLHRAMDNKGGEANTLNNIGGVYDDLGEKQKALEHYNNALTLRRAVGDRAGVATTLNNIGAVYDALGQKQKALEHYNNALPLYRAVGDRSGEANTLNNIGIVYDDLGEKQKALEYFNSALPLRRVVGDKGGEATTFNNMGGVYSDLGQKQKALEYYSSALPMLRAVGDKGGEGNTLNNIGAVYSDLGQKQKALEYYNKALPLRRAVGDRAGVATTLGNIALLERDRGNLQAARTNIEATIKIIEELRTKIGSQELRTSYFATVQGYYKFYIDLLMELHKKAPSQGYDALALHVSERSRARSLIELLNEANAKIKKGANPELIQQERTLLQQIDARDTLRRNLETSANKDDLVTKAAIQRLSKEISNLLSQYQDVQATIRATNPEYAKLTNPDPEKDILKLPQIQQQLDKDTLLLQYSLGKERSYLWAVTPTSMQVYTLPSRKQIEEVATKFYSSLQQPTGSDFAIDNAQQLSKLILAPVADQLARKRLVIVADGGLQIIPFAVLADLSANKYQPLMVNHEIVNLPSASTIAFQRQQLANRKPAPKALAILADPVFNATDCRFNSQDCRETDKPQPITSNLDIPAQLEQSTLDRSAKNLKRNGWERLIHTAEEAKTILKLIPQASSLQAFGFDANYNWATSSTLNQYRILHFATHGIADPQEPALSGIILSKYDKKRNTILPSKLTLADLFNQDYPAELIVLSACKTGLGENVNGEGLVGLTRGLMYAGAARVAVSLWEVSDEGTSVLMQEFYKQMLQQGKTPAAALRAAQQKLWESSNWRSPYYWAGFTVQGEWR